jgi:hypothetical protein
MLVITPMGASARSRFTITPPQPSASSTITVSYSVPGRLPKGHHWVLSMTDRLPLGQSCAVIVTKAFSTRGRRGQILTATFTPQQDVLDNNPTNWCTGQQNGASSWAAFAASATTPKHYHTVGFSFFTIL